MNRQPAWHSKSVNFSLSDILRIPWNASKHTACTTENNFCLLLVLYTTQAKQACSLEGRASDTAETFLLTWSVPTVLRTKRRRLFFSSLFCCQTPCTNRQPRPSTTVLPQCSYNPQPAPLALKYSSLPAGYSLPGPGAASAVLFCYLTSPQHIPGGVMLPVTRLSASHANRVTPTVGQFYQITKVYIFLDQIIYERRISFSHFVIT